VSSVAERSGPLELPDGWEELERAAEDAAVAVAFWRRRALEAEEEVVRLRRALEDVAAEREHPRGVAEETLRLRADNAALRSRMQQARKRVGALLTRLETLENDT
jgi:hypothetical protein